MKAENIIFLSLCICIRDGILSNEEEEKIYELVNKRITKIKKSDFLSKVDLFFNSEIQLEECLQNVIQDGEVELALEIAKEAASADGLDIRENIAFLKAKQSLSIGD
tara:strand:+ start:166 stop:486 length:321 start_codon:yes stop_codon:yes gene_type:complete